MSKRNNTPLTRRDEIFDRPGGSSVFSKLDLMIGSHQVLVKLEEVKNDAFNTKYGQSEYFFMPIGL